MEPNKRRRSILKSYNGQGDDIRSPQPQESNKNSRRRVSFGKSFVKEYHSSTFNQGGENDRAVGYDERSVENMDISVRDFNTTYTVCKENKENYDATFSVRNNSRTYERIFQTPSPSNRNNVTVCIPAPMDIDTVDGSPYSRQSLRTHNSNIQNRSPTKIPILQKASTNNSFSSPIFTKQRWTSPANNNQSCSDNNSVCYLGFSPTKIPVKKSPLRLPSITEPEHLRATTRLSSREIDQQISFLERLDDQREPTLFESMLEYPEDDKRQPINENTTACNSFTSEDEEEEVELVNCNLSSSFKQLLKKRKSVSVKEKLDLLDQTMEELIDIPYEKFYEIKRIYHNSFHPLFLEAVEIHRRIREKLHIQKWMIKLFSLKEQKKNEQKGGASSSSSAKKSSLAHLRMMKDLNELSLPPTCTTEFQDPDDLLNFKLTICPDEGYYKGGQFVLSFKVGQNYPYESPKVKCETKIYHPNIDLEGNVCLNILREDWNPILTINSIVYGLQYLFLEPNADDPLNQEAADDMKKDRQNFEGNVKRAMKGGCVGSVQFDRCLK